MNEVKETELLQELQSLADYILNVKDDIENDEVEDIPGLLVAVGAMMDNDFRDMARRIKEFSGS